MSDLDRSKRNPAARVDESERKKTGEEPIESDQADSRLAVFDFDGTITRAGDSLIRFLWRYGSRRQRRYRLLGLAVDLVRDLRALDPKGVKERVIRRFIAGETREDILAHAESFYDEWVQPRLRPRAMDLLAEHRDRGDRILLLSASPDLYIPVCARRLGIDEVICTEVEFVDGRCTGRIVGENVRGREKLASLKKYLRTDDAPAGSVSYGDSAADRFVLGWTERGYQVRGGEFHLVERAPA